MALYNYKTSNPAFSKDVWKGYASTSKKMTINGIILKSFFCVFLIACTTILTLKINQLGYSINILMFGGLAGALIFSLSTAFIHRLAVILVPLYSLAIGLFLGGIITLEHNKFNGMPLQTIGVTISTFLLVLFLYNARILKVSGRFRSVLIVAIPIIITIYALSWTLQLFSIETPFALIESSSYLAIAFNVLASGIAAFTLLLDFDFIERKKNHVPKYMEWVATWGLLITLVWVYIEALRLMKKIVLN